MQATAPNLRLELIGLPGMPMVQAHDNVADLVLAALAAENLEFIAGDLLVVAQKIISKAEGRMVCLADIVPSDQALALAASTGKDPRLAELIVRESTAIIRTKAGVAIVEHRLGLVHANAGIDQSNIEHGSAQDEQALLLPLDPDASAARLRQAIAQQAGVTPGVIISDSTGRPWRLGTVPIAIGAAGVAMLIDQIGDTDLFGKKMTVTAAGMGDQLAAAAGILMGETDQACPAVLIRGLAPDISDEQQQARALLRPKAEDMFR